MPKNCVQDRCYGCVPILIEHRQVILVHDHHGNWGFPKGHPHAKETPLETAKRELFEETRLTLKCLLEPLPLVMSYVTPQGISKQVFLFLGHVTGTAIPQQGEIQSVVGVDPQDLANALTFLQAQQLVPHILRCIDNNLPNSPIKKH